MFAGRNIEHIRQIPEKLLDVTIQPLMFVLLFAYVFGGAIAVQGGNYREYLIGGILIQSLAFGLTGPATAISTDLTEGVIDRFRSLPATRSAYLAGHYVAELAGHGAVDRRCCSPPGSSSAGACTPIRSTFARRAPAAVLLLLRDDLDRHVDRPHRARARRGDGRRLRRRVPAHVPQQRVRPDQLAARRCCSGSRRGTR